MDRNLFGIARGMLLIALASITAAILLNFRILKHLFTPLGELTETLGRLGEGDLSRRFTVRTRDEIGLLGEYLNDTIAKLAAMDRERNAIHPGVRRLSKKNRLRTGGGFFRNESLLSVQPK